jgi:hypothetical protein
LPGARFLNVFLKVAFLGLLFFGAGIVIHFQEGPAKGQSGSYHAF